MQKPHAWGEGVGVFTLYMSKRSQVIEIIRLVTLLMGGLGAASANAQAPTFSPPTLPPIPGAPGTVNTGTVAPIPSSPGIISPPALEIERPQNPANPSLSDLTSVPALNANAQNQFTTPATPPSDSLADLPPPVAPEAGDLTAGAAMPLPSAIMPPNLPDLPTAMTPPPMPGLLPPPPTVAAIPAPIPAPTTLADIDVGADTVKTPAKEAGPRKSWQTTLAPTSQAYDTKFNYRRALLPGAIYRVQYDRFNEHLPTRVTRTDYERMLFESAARNNIDGTRALINAGTDINAKNPNGETPLAVARRFGAVDTVALLEARGAR